MNLFLQEMLHPTLLSEEYFTCIDSRNQTTLASELLYEGIGIHSGKAVKIRILPADKDTGIIFKRIDLPSHPEIVAKTSSVINTDRSTTIGQQTAVVHTIEHLLSALFAFNVDNCVIEIDNPEVPIGDGSSLAFVDLLEKVGLKDLDSKRPVFTLNKPIVYQEESIQLIGLPSKEFRVSYTLHYPNIPTIGTQFHTYSMDTASFKTEIAPCRTFALYQELEILKKRGLIKGGSLQNAVVIRDDEILCEGGLRFANEMARHKILDLIGDLSLANIVLNMHVIAIGSGHRTNVEFAKKIVKHFTTENI